jgi:nicotinate-nucleotide pyrophosphorylase (carboxylating)
MERRRRAMGRTREEQLRLALFRGDGLCLGNPGYRAAVTGFLDGLLSADLGSGDVTVAALGLAEEVVRARIVAREPGIAAGIEEYAWLVRRGGIGVHVCRRDGERFAAGETLLEIEGTRRLLLGYERVGLNLLQRMSGIATMTRRIANAVRRINPGAVVVATRKTIWGAMDKRAVQLGGGGTHRLGLGDAILGKNNHLALLADREEAAVAIAARRAWESRRQAAFIEIEARGKSSALEAARTFRELRRADPGGCPCLVLLDNMHPPQVAEVLEALRQEGLLEHVLIEASGNISESNAEAYAACGVDAVSIGALTHSPRALDLCQRLLGKEPIP